MLPLGGKRGGYQALVSEHVFRACTKAWRQEHQNQILGMVSCVLAQSEHEIHREI